MSHPSLFFTHSPPLSPSPASFPEYPVAASFHPVLLCRAESHSRQYDSISLSPSWSVIPPPPLSFLHCHMFSPSCCISLSVLLIYYPRRNNDARCRGSERPLLLHSTRHKPTQSTSSVQNMTDTHQHQVSLIYTKTTRGSAYGYFIFDCYDGDCDKWGQM